MFAAAFFALASAAHIEDTTGRMIRFFRHVLKLIKMEDKGKQIEASLKLQGSDRFNNPRWHAANNRIIRHVLIHHSAGGNDRVFSDGIVSDIELINIQQINEAYDRLLKSDVKYRFVIDMASLKK